MLPCVHKLNQALINAVLYQKHCTFKLNSLDGKEATYEKSELNRMTSDNRAFARGCKQEIIFGNNFVKVEQEMNFRA